RRGRFRTRHLAAQGQSGLGLRPCLVARGTRLRLSVCRWPPIRFFLQISCAIRGWISHRVAKTRPRGAATMNEQSLFIEALEKQGPAERAAYLDQACAGAQASRQRVERLLERHYQAGSFLEPPAQSLAGTIEAPTDRETPGTLIGPYKLLQQIGEGGMG